MRVSTSAGRARRLAEEAPFPALRLHRDGELLEDFHLRAPEVVDGLLPVSHRPEQPRLERQGRRALGSQRARSAGARLGEEVHQLELHPVGVLELVEEERPDALLLPGTERGVPGEQRPGAEQQLGEVEGPCLVEGRALALLQRDQEPLPGLLVRARQVQRHRGQWRGGPEERVAERLQRRGEAVPSAPGKRIAQLGQPRRTFQRGPRSPADQDIGHRGQQRQAVGTLGMGSLGGRFQHHPDPLPRLLQSAIDVGRGGEHQPCRRVSVVPHAAQLIHQELHQPVAAEPRRSRAVQSASTPGSFASSASSTSRSAASSSSSSASSSSRSSNPGDARLGRRPAEQRRRRRHGRWRASPTTAAAAPAASPPARGVPGPVR